MSSLVKDVDTSPVIRKALLESLAWFTLSDQKADIIEACKEILQQSWQVQLIRRLLR